MSDLSRRQAKQTPSRPRRTLRRWRPALERLEDRLAPAILTVNTEDDNTTADPLLTLREAIALVNNGGDANLALGRSLDPGEAAQISGVFGTNDTINFAGNVQTITLGGTELSILAAVAIDGPGADDLTIDANDASRIFADGSAGSMTVSITGLTLTNGNAVAGNGGAILIGNDSWTISDAAVTRSSSANFGGGIFSGTGSSLTVQDSTISGNTATSRGGGIASGGAGNVVTVIRSSISGNSSQTGGGIDTGNCTLTVQHSSVRGNHALAGGGIWAQSTNLLVQYSEISRNVCENFAGGITGTGTGSTFTIENSTVSENAAFRPIPAAEGVGGILATSGTTWTIRNCTIFNNSASAGTERFGGIQTRAASMTIENCTISGNDGATGGAIATDDSFTGTPTLTVRNTTIHGNNGGIHIIDSGANTVTVNLESTIVAGNTAGGRPDIERLGSNTTLNVDHSLIGVAPAAGVINGANTDNIVDQDPLLGPLADNGGPTQTHLLLAGSPALNQGSNSAGLTTDQRGPSFLRQVGAGVDIGAVESQTFAVPLVVDNLGDDADGDYSAGELTLREAIGLAQGGNNSHTVTFAAGLTGTIQLGREFDQFLIASDLEIMGPGANRLTIDAAQLDARIFAGVGPDNTVTISGLTLTGGNAYRFKGEAEFDTVTADIVDQPFTGGAILILSGDWTIADSVLSGNHARWGGGIAVMQLDAAATLTVRNSTISGNTALLPPAIPGVPLAYGGAIYGFAVSSVDVIVEQCTISGNDAGATNGEIRVFGGTSSVTVRNTTVFGKSVQGNGTIHGSLLVGPGAGISGGMTGTHNLIDNATPVSDIIDPVLQYNGGTTLTHALAANSPALDVGMNFTSSNFDQRGQPFLRQIGLGVDIGAFEAQPLGLIATGTGRGTPEVAVFRPGGEEVGRFNAFATGVGGVRVAVGDVTGDGVPDIIAGAGNKRKSFVRVFDGRTFEPVGGLLGQFQAFGNKYRSGVYVAAGNIDGDAHADIIVGKGAGSAVVKIYSGLDGSLIDSFKAGAIGGARVAAADLTNDGVAEILVGTGAGVKGRVKTYTGAGTLITSFLAFTNSYKGGVFVAAGDTNNDGIAEVLVGRARGASVVRLLTADGSLVDELPSVFEAGFTGGVRVAILDSDLDGQVEELLAAPGVGRTQEVHRFELDLEPIDSFFAYSSNNGVFVG